MWLGTREEQTPQPVRMTLGNKGAIHPPSLCFHWSFLFGFPCCALVYPRAATGNPINMESVLLSFVILFWLVIALLLSYIAFRSLPISIKWSWQKVNEIPLNVWVHRCRTTAKCVLSVTVCFWHSYSYVTQLCVVLDVASGHQLSPSPLHWLEWLPNFSSPSLVACIHTDSLPCPQPDTDWQQPAIRGGAWAADLHFKEAEQRSPARGHGQHRHCGAQVIIWHFLHQ